MTLAVSGHMVMSGPAPSPWAAAAAFLAVLVAAAAFTGRERGRAAVILAALAAQALLHGAFSAFSASAASSAAVPGAPHGDGSAGPPAGRVLCHAPPAAQDPACAAVDGAAHALPAQTPGMIGAHLVVALLSAWWLWRGERAVFALLRWAALRVLLPALRPASRLAPPSADRAVRAPESAPVPRQLLLVRRTGSRGPPPPWAARAAARRHGRALPA
ncbi:hypothetical protein [Streptomyces marincola]|uniref:hypothetical protein n=1 Tax=Streptomyces marincola TaxID=2878388 RepID=UPI001CF45A03|nr:hypothetical protein [Streptomyces marincola]UCM86735.1 hypothetical protein LC193_01585 [Streptomyces marincola]